MANCKKCGAILSDVDDFCPECGQKLFEAEKEIVKTVNNDKQDIVGVGKYILFSVLFSLPLIGIVTAIILVCGGTKSKNLRNYAISALILSVVSIILFTIVCLAAFGFAVMIGNVMDNYDPDSGEYYTDPDAYYDSYCPFSEPYGYDFFDYYFS